MVHNIHGHLPFLSDIALLLHIMGCQRMFLGNIGLKMMMDILTSNSRSRVRNADCSSGLSSAIWTQGWASV